MGATFSCNGGIYDALEESFDAMLVRSFSFNEDGVRTDLRSVSFNGRDKEPTILKRLASGKMFMEGSVSFKNTREMDTMIPIQSTKEMEMENHGYKSVPFDTNEFCNSFLRSNSFTDVPITPMPIMDQNSHDAALKLQKVYKSFRTRRKLADCAVLVEQRWWKLLDFAELKMSSVSFFEIEKPETAVSRWSRARTRAAKVGKGLSKDEKAQKLAFQHWLEAIDPRHRYGHNLSFYYVTWLHCESQQPFFYWLDIGEGKEVNIVDKCPRAKLQQQCIKYLGPIERKVYEVVVEDGKFIYKHTGQLLDSTGEPGDVKWIFVLSTSKTLYVGQKCKGRFQHSSFLAGGATSAAGRLVVETGILKAVWPHSGHYRPTDENFREFISFLKENNVDITDVQLSPAEEEEESGRGLGLGLGLTSNASDSDLTRETEAEAEAEAEAETENANTDEIDSAEGPNAKRSDHFKKKLTNLEIPKRVELFTKSVAKGPTIGPSIKGSSEKDATAGYETAEDSLDSESDDDYLAPKLNLFEGEQEEDEEDIVVPKEIILRRINSKKGMGSYQLGKQLSCKWTTGAGPRIGCVRDYPSELQCRVLEQVCLSPRSAAHSRHHSSPLNMLFPSPRPPMPPSPLVSTPWPKLPTPGPMRRDATTTTKNTR